MSVKHCASWRFTTLICVCCVLSFLSVSVHANDKNKSAPQPDKTDKSSKSDKSASPTIVASVSTTPSEVTFSTEDYPTVYATGSVHLRKNSTTTNDDVLFARGSVHIQAEARLNSDLFTTQNLHLGKHAELYGNYIVQGEIQNDRKSTIKGTEFEDSDFPNLAIPQIFPDSSSVNITLKKKQTRVLDEGQYGSLTTGVNSTLILSGGVYHFENFHIGMHGQVVVEAPTLILVTNAFQFSSNTKVDFFNNNLLPEDFVIYTLSFDSNKVGIYSDFQGTIYAPNGALHVRHNARFTGSFYGQDLIIGKHVKADFVPSNAEVFCDFEIVECGGTDPDDYDMDGYTPAEGDCDDLNAYVYPTASELCDGVDNNCDQLIDGLDSVNIKTWYFDFDYDGFGDKTAQTKSCIAPESFVDNRSDCGPFNPAVSPQASEKCTDTIDNDCDGRTNEGCSCEIFAEVCDDGIDQDCNGSDKVCDYSDSDQDGVTSAAGDCDDNNASVLPGADEYCDGFDNNCDSFVDEYTALDKQTWFLDADFDTYGNGNISIESCEDYSLFVSDNSDCNDSDPSTNPGQIEFCDGIDNNCNSIIDEDCL